MKIRFRKPRQYCALALALAGLSWSMLGVTQDNGAQQRVVRIDGFGAESSVLRQFGLNSEAAMRAAADRINAAGGVKLGDGARGKIEIKYYDDQCQASQGLSLVKKMAAGDTLAAVGTTCSPVVEAVFGSLQKHAGDAADSGLQIPVYTDVAMKLGLARKSDWAFRNIPDEIGMYKALFAWVHQTYPQAKTVYGGVEENFVHSRQTWYDVMKKRAQDDGYDVQGEAKWLVDDTNFASQVADIKRVNPDILVISAHPFTACGVLKEMKRQGVAPKLLIGLTSISSPETLAVCGKEAEGLIIPTSFAPINPAAKSAADATAQYKGYADLHSMAAWEIMYAIKTAIETQGVLARPDTVQADRAKLRAGLAAEHTIDGLLGPVQRTAERESVKPYVIVEAKANQWSVIDTPVQ